MNVRSPRVTHSNVPMVTVDSIAVEGWGAIAPPKYSVGIINIVIENNSPPTVAVSSVTDVFSSDGSTVINGVMEGGWCMVEITNSQWVC